MIQTNLIVSSVHSHVSGNSLRTRSAFFVEDPFFALNPVSSKESGADSSTARNLTWDAISRPQFRRAVCTELKCSSECCLQFNNLRLINGWTNYPI